ncbi:MAG: hypothetical protein RIB45_04220 [Marivibrio sp.]|uniref:hypothetical protein n=1 Tax=Marivibrio sp. TaxID=2039719 RepID=UPI0032EC180B
MKSGARSSGDIAALALLESLIVTLLDEGVLSQAQVDETFEVAIDALRGAEDDGVADSQAGEADASGPDQEDGRGDGDGSWADGPNDPASTRRREAAALLERLRAASPL